MIIQLTNHADLKSSIKYACAFACLARNFFLEN